MRMKLDRLIFDLLIFNGSTTNPLNPKLRFCIEDEWITGDDLRNQAMFLRLRMRALAKRDYDLGGDDEDYLC